jgi:hypothetical protein
MENPWEEFMLRLEQKVLRSLVRGKLERGN